jgi:hypothetical protein
MIFVTARRGLLGFPGDGAYDRAMGAQARSSANPHPQLIATEAGSRDSVVLVNQPEHLLAADSRREVDDLLNTVVRGRFWRAWYGGWSLQCVWNSAYPPRRCRLSTLSRWSRHFRRMVPTNRFA